MRRSSYKYAVVAGVAFAISGCKSDSARPTSDSAPAGSASAAVASADPVEVYAAALERVAECPLSADGVAVKDVSACLKPSWDALRAIDSPPEAAAQTPAARMALVKELHGKLSRRLESNLASKNRTVVLYSLYQNQSRFERTPTVLAKFEELMKNDDAPTAEWAAIGRFWRVDKMDSKGLDLAKATLKGDKHDRVRKAGCDYIGDRSFRGDRAHFDLLLSYAKNNAEPDIVRSCATLHLGDLGDESDVGTIAGLLADKKTQYSAVYALKLGVRTKRSFDAYVDYFAKNATKDDALEFAALTIFAPWDADLEKFPKAKALKALSTILTTPTVHSFTRGNAAYALGRLKAKHELEQALKKYDKATAPEEKHVKEQIERAMREFK